VPTTDVLPHNSRIMYFVGVVANVDYFGVIDLACFPSWDLVWLRY